MTNTEMLNKIKSEGRNNAVSVEIIETGAVKMLDFGADQSGLTAYDYLYNAPLLARSDVDADDNAIVPAADRPNCWAAHDVESIVHEIIAHGCAMHKSAYNALLSAIE